MVRNFSKVWGSLNYVTLEYIPALFHSFCSKILVPLTILPPLLSNPGNDHHPSVTIKASVEMPMSLCQALFFFFLSCVCFAPVFLMAKSWQPSWRGVAKCLHIFMAEEPRVVTLMSRVQSKLNGLSVVKLMGFPVRSADHRHVHARRTVWASK